MADYVDKDELSRLVKIYHEKKDRRTYEKIAKIFMLIAWNLLNKPCFINYSQDRKEEMVSDAVYFMIKYINKFDSQKNPFSYATMTAINAFRQYINEQKKREKMFHQVEYIENFDRQDEQYFGDNTDE